MFSLPSTFQPQVTIPLSHLINAFHSLKSSASSVGTASIQCLQREPAPEHDFQSSEPSINLRELGLNDLKISHLDDLVNRLLPSVSTEHSPSHSHWRTSHVSANSFFHNKHGFSSSTLGLLGTPTLCRQHTRPLQAFCSDLQNWPVRFRTTSGLDAAVDPVQMKNVTFEHVKGAEEAKNELQEVVEFLKNPQKFTVLGGKLPKGILLIGPPGTGKTLLARAVAGEADVPFYYASGSEFDEMFVGVGASRIRNLFSVDPERIARGTVGFSGADLENLVNQAALKAAVDEKDMVTMEDLEFAKDKILMGPERRSVEIDKRNKTITAYHESGHAIVAFYTKDAMPINKATIMPRGPTLGHVSLLPENDGWSETRSQLLAQMDVSMGGRVAEELVFGNENITTGKSTMFYCISKKGASSDFDSATKIAKMMVMKFGMSEKLGVMTYTDTAKLSPETQAAIEQEVRVLLKDSYERAKHILKSRSKEHKYLADALLTYETLNAKEIQIILDGKNLEPR
ncbi:UNVERIFIED_CONTAM: hypothetical protein FKN15_041945 [Acipenser sinensis]